MTTKREKEERPLGCIIGMIGILSLIIYFIVFIFKRDLPFWPLIIVFIMLFIGAGKMQMMNNEDEKERFKKQGIDPEKFIYAGKYLSGHTKIDLPKENCYLYVKDKFLEIYALNNGTMTKDFLANIEISKIKNISLEDESSIQTRVGLKRLLAIGLFAFAIKKKTKLELSYVVIEWNDDRFDHETVFEFEGTGAVTKGNFLRNKLINQI